jgi:hypothetical protein
MALPKKVLDIIYRFMYHEWQESADVYFSEPFFLRNIAGSMKDGR